MRIEYASKVGTYTVDYTPFLFPSQPTINPHAMRPFSNENDMKAFVGLAVYFAFAWHIRLEEQLPEYLTVEAFKPIDDSEEYVFSDSDEYDLPTGPAVAQITTTTARVIGAQRSAIHTQPDTYTVRHKGTVKAVRRLSISVFDPADVQDWLNQIATQSDFYQLLPRNYKVLN